jgi:hypothetical protein
MSNPQSTAEPPAGAPLPEFEDRILAAIEEAERVGELPPLSSNTKRLLFLRLQKLREGLDFVDGAHRRWPDLPEKREQAARSRIVRGIDVFTGRRILNNKDFQAVIDQQNAVETIDFVGRVETVKLLVYAFQKIIEIYFTIWSESLDLRYEEFRKWGERIRFLVVAECRAEWLGRRLAERKAPSPDDVADPSALAPLPEFEGLPPLWFDYLPLADAARLEGDAAVWSKRARKFEVKHRAQPAAETVSSERAAAPPTPAPTEIAAPATSPEVIATARPVKPPQRITLSGDTAITIEPAAQPITPGEWLRTANDATAGVETSAPGDTQSEAGEGDAVVGSRSRLGRPMSKPNQHPEVEKFLAKVGEYAKRRVTIREFCAVSGFTDDTVFGWWRRGDPRCTAAHARKFEKTLKLTPQQFLGELTK